MGKAAANFLKRLGLTALSSTKRAYLAHASAGILLRSSSSVPLHPGNWLEFFAMRALITLSSAALLGALFLTAAAPSTTLAAGATPAPAAGVPATAASYGVDLSHSNIIFKTKHLGVAYQYGRFDKFAGQFTLGADDASSSVSITVEAESVNTNDEKRDAHLRNADFFNVKQFPEMIFESTKVTKGEGDAYSIVGDLTLHGTKKEITMAVTKVGEEETRMGQRCGFEGSFTIDRMDFGINGVPKMLGHDVHMLFAIEGVVGK